jgi:hypothetical protein
MNTRNNCSNGYASAPQLLVGLVLCLSIGCSKSINSIGPFEGYWSGELGFYISSGFDTGIIQFEVGSDRSVEGYGEVWFRESNTQVKAFELTIDGMVNPNGALECHYSMRWTHPSIEFIDMFPPGHGDHKNGSIGGYLNPAFNYGIGENAWLAWLVHRHE